MHWTLTLHVLLVMLYQALVSTMPTLFYMDHQNIPLKLCNESRTHLLVLFYSLTGLFHPHHCSNNFIGFVPIDKRINFKLATLILRAQTTLSPNYLATLLHTFLQSSVVRPTITTISLCQNQLWLSRISLCCSIHLELSSFSYPLCLITKRIKICS